MRQKKKQLPIYKRGEMLAHIVSLTKNIDYYCFSVDDFLGLNEIKHQDVPDLCKKFNIKKNLIKPIYLS